ncbi:MAG: bifunctional (p)ppGpp synthetase/guanosine-3',5'-bis(diphosphate) 3'-pyrophosphohydrolase [Verrucomicrobia bacterium]|nr:bifunctional (p)ppGpp synthetase/guanosine-3',5'-bis(diphosphate) 3'-pyrophosphohydrolase [Verrucomicrobiota bacterium]
MPSSDTTKEISSLLLGALKFAAYKHRRQRRKDLEASPYINHPIEVAEALSRIGGITDLFTLQAAILHDTIEDTETSPQELEDYFGQEVCLLVQELTDDKNLPKQERKRLQVEHAPNLSTRAKLIKLGDKICNVGEITATQPAEWPLQRKLEYLDWAERVVSGCRDCNLELAKHFDAVLKKSRESLV